MTEKKNKLVLPLALGAAGLVLVGGVATYWWMQRQNTGVADLPLGSNLIPQNALMAVSVSTESNQWTTLRQFGTPQSQKLFDQTLAEWRDRLLTANGYNYQKDIQPWVGREVTFAFLPTSTTPTAAPSPSPTPNAAPPTGQQSVVLVLPIANPAQAQRLLTQAKPPTAGQWSDRSYKGVQIRESKEAAQQTYSAAVLDGRFLIVGTDPQATEQAIDTAQGAASLLNTPGYTNAFSKLNTSQPFAQVYVNIPTAAAVAARNANQPVAPEQLSQQYQGFAANLSLQPEGVNVQSVAWLQPNSQRKFAVDNSAKNMTGRLPATTLMMASGGNFKQFWQQYIQGAGTQNSASLINPEILRAGLQSTTGLDLDKDLLEWMGGEFAIALISSPQKTPADLPVGLMVMAQATNRRAAEATFKKLDEVIASKYSFKVSETQVANRPAVTWSLPLGGPLVTHGWMDGNIAFLTLGAPVATQALPQPQTPLASSALFQATMPTALEPNNGHFFVDVDRTLSSNLSLLQLAPTNKAWLSAIQGIGVTAVVSDERSTRFDVFAKLRKGGKPGPLPSPAATTNSNSSPSPAPNPSP